MQHKKKISQGQGFLHWGEGINFVFGPKYRPLLRIHKFGEKGIFSVKEGREQGFRTNTGIDPCLQIPLPPPLLITSASCSLCFPAPLENSKEPLLSRSLLGLVFSFSCPRWSWYYGWKYFIRVKYKPLDCIVDPSHFFSNSSFGSDRKFSNHC